MKIVNRRKKTNKLISMSLVVSMLFSIIIVAYQNISSIQASQNNVKLNSDNITFVKQGQDLQKDFKLACRGGIQPKQDNFKVSSRAKTDDEKTHKMWMEIKETDKGYCLIDDVDDRIDRLFEEADVHRKEFLEDMFGENKRIQKKYISTFFKAEYATLYPDLRNTAHIGKKVPKNELQGKIQIKRADKNNKVSLLEYCPYEDFEGMMNSQDVLKYFSLYEDENGEIMLVVAKMNSVETEKISNDPQIEKKWIAEGKTPEDHVSIDEENNKINDKRINEKSITYSPVSIAYQNLVNTYSMPFQLLWSILSVSKDKDFVMDLAQLALNSEIVITVQDNETTVVDVNKDEYNKSIYNDIGLNDKDEKTEGLFIKLRGICDNPGLWTLHEGKEIGHSDLWEEKGFYNITTITTITNTPYIDVTKANTWLIEYLNDYSYNTSNSIYGGEPSEEYNEEEFVSVEDVFLQDDPDNPVSNRQEDMKLYDGVSSLISAYKNNDEGYKTLYRECLKACIESKWDKKWNNSFPDVVKDFLNKYKETIIERVYNAGSEEIAIKDLIDDWNKSYSPQEPPTVPPSEPPPFRPGDPRTIEPDALPTPSPTPTPTPPDAEPLNLPTEDLSPEDKSLDDEDQKKIKNFINNVQKDYNKNKNQWLEKNLKVWITELKLSVMEKRVDIITTNTQTITTKMYSQGIPEVREKIEEKPENGEENFITLFNSSKYAKINLGTSTEWLFKFLAEHGSTANMVDVMKWILGKATGLEELQGIVIDWMSLIYGLGWDEFSGADTLEGLKFYLNQFEDSSGKNVSGHEHNGKLYYKMYDKNKIIGLGIIWYWHQDKFDDFGDAYVENSDGSIIENNARKES